jgi:hypothetical protein
MRSGTDELHSSSLGGFVDLLVFHECHIGGDKARLLIDLNELNLSAISAKSL